MGAAKLLILADPHLNKFPLSLSPLSFFFSSSLSLIPSVLLFFSPKGGIYMPFLAMLSSAKGRGLNSAIRGLFEMCVGSGLGSLCHQYFPLSL